MKQSLLNILAFSCLILLSGLAPSKTLAQTGEVSVTGTGEVAAVPDMAILRVGVSHRSDAARMAMEQVSDAMTRVLRRLDARGVPADQVQTGQISLSPVRNDRDPNRLGGQVAWDLFEARSTLVIELTDLDLLGSVMEEILSDGANEVSGLRFSVQDPAPFEAEARARAVQDAATRANQLADAAGIGLGDILEISEHGGGPRPMAEMASARSGGGVPVAAGTVSVRVSVQMRFAIR